jgi:hypothetical protein
MLLNSLDVFSAESRVGSRRLWFGGRAPKQAVNDGG